MKKLISLALCLIPFLSALTQSDMSILDAYKLKFGETKLFEQYDKFIEKHGLPTTVKVALTDYPIKTKEDIRNAIKKATVSAIITLKYPGLDMWFSDEEVIPASIDLRKITDKITYKDSITLDTGFSLAHFKMLFPVSAQEPIPQDMSDMSVFTLITGEKGPQYQHFMLLRKTKDDASVRLPIQFTFHNNKLIFICFLNVS